MTTVTSPQPSQEVQNFLSQAPKMLIDGKRVEAASGKTFEVLDPANNEVLSHVPKGEKEDIDRAVSAARKAFRDGPGGKSPFPNVARFYGNWPT